MSHFPLEVSIFGPGYGECILIHIGANKWVVIDSCLNSKKESVALHYLNEIGVPFVNIVQVIATHWHDDHIRGLAQIVQEAKHCIFTFSSALSCDEFFTLAANNGLNISTTTTSGIQEFHKILDIINLRGSKLQFADENKQIFLDTELSVSIKSLSPSDETRVHALKKIADLFPQVNMERKRLPSITPNIASVVTHIKINDQEILLGADLEESNLQGWSTIISSQTRDSIKANIFKIPHHGSRNADIPQIWSTLLIKHVAAVVTPYSKGKKLPSNADIKRLKENTENLFQTSAPEAKRITRTGVSQKLINSTVKSIQTVQYCCGQVRFRFDPVAKIWNEELFGNASKL